MNENIINGVRELAWAIIDQAIIDYKELSRNGSDLAQTKMREIEKFFNSSWFVSLNTTKYSGSEIINMLRISCAA